VTTKGRARRKAKTVADINARLKRGEAVVMTAQEFKDGIRKGKSFTLDDVDVVTTATHGIMSGTAASFSVPVADRGVFRRAQAAWINGVAGAPGPTPNERLGYVDLIIYGTTGSRDRPHTYGGGHLFRDLVERRPVTIEILTDTGSKMTRQFTLDDLSFARMYSFRNSFKSYMAFGNFRGGEPVRTIFSYRPMTPETGITAIGSGELSPLQNDPHLRTVGVGTLAMVNDSPGVVVGGGTLSYPDRPNLSIVADMFKMDARYMGGVATSEGVEVLNAVSIPIPVLDEEILADLAGALDEKLKLPVADVHDRVPFTDISYAEVWQGRDLTITFGEPGTGCGPGCAGASGCPVGAIDWNKRSIDERKCTRCGACTVLCEHGTFVADLGSAMISGKPVPITYRTSDRVRALELMNSLKAKLLEGEVRIGEKLMDIVPTAGKH
jgi:putative methanogenesis marker 16 metalloprotein